MEPRADFELLVGAQMVVVRSVSIALRYRHGKCQKSWLAHLSSMWLSKFKLEGLK